jgi:O-methyltransferase
MNVARNAMLAAETQIHRLRRSVVLNKRDRALVPDLEAYRPFFHPWDVDNVRRELRADDPRSAVSPDRKYVLRQLLSQAAATREGEVAECGVYKGGTSYLLAETLVRLGGKQTLYLLDTFAGMPETREGVDLHKAGDFADTSLTSVKSYLSEFDNLQFVSGSIPESLEHLPRVPFCFVHIDLDIHDPIVAASEFFYPLLPSGGVIVYDDYGFSSCPGARRAVDTFYEGRPEYPLVLATGQCVVFKI